MIIGQFVFRTWLKSSRIKTHITSSTNLNMHPLMLMNLYMHDSASINTYVRVVRGEGSQGSAGESSSSPMIPFR